METMYKIDRKNLPNLKTGIFLKQNLHRYSFFVRLHAIPFQAVLINQFIFMVETLPSTTPPRTTKYLSCRFGLKDSIETDQWEMFKRNFTQPVPNLGSLIRFLKCLSITIAVMNRQTGQCSLLLSTAGGTPSIQENNNGIVWEFLPRLADSDPNPMSLATCIIPKVKASLKLSADYSNMETLDVQVV
jgi:hypothetical protein